MNTKKQIKKVFTGVLVGATALMGAVSSASAATVTNFSVALTDSRPSATGVSYTVAFNHATAGNVGCIDIAFRTTPTGSTVIPGMATETGGTGTLVSTSGEITGSGWTKTAGTDSNFRITRTAAAVTATTSTIVIGNVTNPSAVQTTPANGSYYARITTYLENTCTTTVDTGVAAFDILNGVVVSATVDPTLTVAVATRPSGETVKGGDPITSNDCGVSSTALAFPTAMVPDTNYLCVQTVAIGTNANGGFSTTVRSTRADSNFLRVNTSRQIADVTNVAGPTYDPVAWPGYGFGFTTDQTTLSAGGPGGASRFSATDSYSGIPNTASVAASPLLGEIAYQAAAGSLTSRVGYRLRFNSTQAAGAYQGTLVYLTTANF